jgi:hypothetical protein
MLQSNNSMKACCCYIICLSHHAPEKPLEHVSPKLQVFAQSSLLNLFEPTVFLHRIKFPTFLSLLHCIPLIQLMYTLFWQCLTLWIATNCLRNVLRGGLLLTIFALSYVVDCYMLSSKCLTWWIVPHYLCNVLCGGLLHAIFECLKWCGLLLTIFAMSNVVDCYTLSSQCLTCWIDCTPFYKL